MAITCPRCGSQFDATLFQFGQRVRCPCGAEVEYPERACEPATCWPKVRARQVRRNPHMTPN